MGRSKTWNFESRWLLIKFQVLLRPIIGFSNFPTSHFRIFQLFHPSNCSMITPKSEAISPSLCLTVKFKRSNIYLSWNSEPSTFPPISIKFLLNTHVRTDAIVTIKAVWIHAITLTNRIVNTFVVANPTASIIFITISL